MLIDAALFFDVVVRCGRDAIHGFAVDESCGRDTPG
jgi:hypothetical protein